MHRVAHYNCECHVHMSAQLTDKHKHTSTYVQYSIECSRCNSVVLSASLSAFYARLSCCFQGFTLAHSTSSSASMFRFFAALILMLGFVFNSQSIGCYKMDYVPLSAARSRLQVPSIRQVHSLQPSVEPAEQFQLVVARHSLSIDDSYNYGHYNGKYIFMAY